MYSRWINWRRATWPTTNTNFVSAEMGDAGAWRSACVMSLMMVPHTWSGCSESV